MQKIYNIPTKQDNDILTQGGDSLITESTFINLPLVTEDLEGLITQSNENIMIKSQIGEPYFLVWDDEENLSKNYSPTIINKIYGN